MSKHTDEIKARLLLYRNKYRFLAYKYFELAEYQIENFFDPLPTYKKNEKMDEYCRRLPIRQAVRYARRWVKH